MIRPLRSIKLNSARMNGVDHGHVKRFTSLATKILVKYSSNIGKSIDRWVFLDFINIIPG